jgi:choline dehydrogenase-like flavoprotein
MKNCCGLSAAHLLVYRLEITINLVLWLSFLTPPFFMKFIDLEELENDSLIEADLCIVGSGPAGVTIAKEFSGSRIQVLILEGGGLEQTSADQALYDFENVGAIRNTPSDYLLRNRSIGGTSTLWNGRCVAFDDIDFESKPWLPHSGWPINPSDIRPFLDRSRRYLGLGPHIYDERLWKELGISSYRWRIAPTYLKSQFWQYSRGTGDSSEAIRFSRTLAEMEAPNIKLLMHANVTQINTSEDGTRIESLEFRTLNGRRAKATAKAIVLACGGLENARLLLASNRFSRNGVGNSHDLVGRFLMDHPGCRLGRFDPRQSISVQRRFGHYLLDHKDGRNLYAFGLKLSPDIQREEHLLNCAAFLDPAPPTYDSWSALKRLIRPGVERRRGSGAKDAAVVIGDLPWLLGNVYRRVVWRQGLIQRTDELSLSCLVEQTPDPASRVTLAEKTDALGMPLLRIDWRIGELERQSVMRLSELVVLELRRAGFAGHFRSNQSLDNPNWRSQFIDHNHPSGTTRMSVSPKQGVVDQNCKVHETKGLYIAGSSVFPTAGHANPTLMIVALAIRLADWLKRTEFAD